MNYEPKTQNLKVRNKKELRALIADGQLPDALEGALAYAEASADTETLNGLIGLQSDLSKHHGLWGSGQIAFEEYARAQARITAALLGRVDELPDAPTKAAAQQRMPENTLKWQVFYLFVASKALVFLWVFFNWKVAVGGFQNEEAMTAFNALLPGLVIYTPIMFNSLFRTATGGDAPRRYVPTRFRSLVQLFFLFYTALVFFLIHQKVTGNIGFTMMNLAIAGTETGMGAMVREMVEGLYRKNTGMN